jgi:hypothetical protein
LQVRIFRVDPLDVIKLDLSPTPAVFLSLAADSLGVHGTHEDGFPSLLLSAAAGLDNLVAGALSLDPLITRWAAAGELVGVDTLAGEREALESDVRVGDTLALGVGAGVALPTHTLPTITRSQLQALPIFGPNGFIATALEIQAGLIQLIPG